MEETRQQKAVRYWNIALRLIDRRLKRIKSRPLQEGDYDSAWEEIDRLGRLESFARTCLRLAEEGNFSSLAFLDGI